MGGRRCPAAEQRRRESRIQVPDVQARGPVHTRDGIRVVLQANIERSDDVPKRVRNEAEIVLGRDFTVDEGARGTAGVVELRDGGARLHGRGTRGDPRPGGVRRWH